MLKHKNLTDYVNIGTLHSDDQVHVSVAFQGENTLENQFIVNRFPNNKENNYWFKTFFSYYSKKSHTQDFCNFFTFDNSFFCVFKYLKCEHIKKRFDKKLCTSPFEERCELLEKILMRIENLSDFPLAALVSITNPENICIDDKTAVQFVYNMGDVFKNKDCTKFDLYNNIHDIIYIMLQKEADAQYNKALHIVLDKCKSGVYSSIPQLTVELKRAEKISQNSTWFSYIKYQLVIRKPQLSRYSKVGMTSLIGAALIYMAYNQVTKNSSMLSTAPAVAIGEVTYNGDNTDESEKALDGSAENTLKVNTISDITLSEGLDLEYEDYIVQYGDTIDSIAKSYYQDESYITAIATFNGIGKQDKPTAGQIIKLPNRTAIALYLSN